MLFFEKIKKLSSKLLLLFVFLENCNQFPDCIWLNFKFDSFVLKDPVATKSFSMSYKQAVYLFKK